MPIPDFLDYNTSPLNPALKILAILVFLVIGVIFYKIRGKYGGKVQIFINYLFLFSLSMAVASVIRYFGHGTEFGFTTDYSLKWFQSLAYIFAGGFLVCAARTLLTLFRQR
jgi:hypothetical protein